MDETKQSQIQASFARKKPPDVQLPIDNTISPVSTSGGSSQPVRSAGFSPAPTFHFELPSQPTSPTGSNFGGNIHTGTTNSGACSSQAQSPPPPFDDAERISQFQRFKQEVNRRMN